MDNWKPLAMHNDRDITLPLSPHNSCTLFTVRHGIIELIEYPSNSNEVLECRVTIVRKYPHEPRNVGCVLLRTHSVIKWKPF